MDFPFSINHPAIWVSWLKKPWLFHPGTARIFIAGLQSRRSLKSPDAPLSPVAAKKNSSLTTLWLSHKNQAMMTLKGIHWLDWLDIEYLKWDATCLREHTIHSVLQLGSGTAASIPWRWCQKASWPTSWNQGPLKNQGRAHAGDIRM